MNKEGSRFSDGFLLGILVGGAIVFLLGTEKGKKVLRLLTSEGGLALEGILRDLDDAPSPAENHSAKRKHHEPEIVDAEDLNFSEHEGNGYKREIKKETKATHRFFKGTKTL